MRPFGLNRIAAFLSMGWGHLVRSLSQDPTACGAHIMALDSMQLHQGGVKRPLKLKARSTFSFKVSLQG